MDCAGSNYFDYLHQYELAYQIYRQALAQNPNNASHVSNFAEASLATERFREAHGLARRVLAGPPEVSEAPSVSVSLAMRFIILTSLLLQQQAGEAGIALQQLLEFYNGNIAAYRTPEWRYTGTEHFIRQRSMTEPSRALLLKVLKILETPAGPVPREQFAPALANRSGPSE